MKTILRLILIAFLPIFLVSCQTTSSGIGEGSFVSPDSARIEVLDLPFHEAVDLALEAATEAYSDVDVSPDGLKVFINNRSFWEGDAQALIDPILVKDNGSERVGIIFEVVSEGVGANFSMIPGYLTKGFFRALTKIVEDREITKLEFQKYRKLNDKGVAPTIAASIPVDPIQFRKYVDSFEERDPFVGVWETDSGEYTLGMVPDNRDRIHKYKMFVLNSKYRNWKPGEVKISFSRLDRDGLAVGRYRGRAKAEIGLSFESREDVLVSLNSPYNTKIILIKTYPSELSGPSWGIGSSWYVGKNLFVTNAHVVDGANKIDLLVDEESVSARVAALDKRLDVAILRVAEEVDLVPVPVGTGTNLGEKITVIGFPLGEELGNAPKITDGLLSGDSGLDDDPTRYLISAPIQPGNSGGPVFGSKGYVIGVSVSKLTSNLTDNVGFAIKMQYVLPLLEEMGWARDTDLPSDLSPEELCKKYCGSVVQVRTN